MRVNPELENRQLLEETFKMARDAKRAAEHTRTMLFWLHLASWVKTAIFLVVAVVGVVMALRTYRQVTTALQEVKPNQVIQEVLSGQAP